MNLPIILKMIYTALKVRTTMRKYLLIHFAALIIIPLLLITYQSGSGAGMDDMQDHQHGGMHMKSVSPGEVVVKLETRPAKLKAGVPAEITFLIRDKEEKPVKDLSVMHERLLHVIIVSGDFNTFAHIHPEDFGPITEEMKKKAEYSVSYTFPVAGTYLIALDSAVKGALFSEHFMVDVSGEPKMGTLKGDFSREKRFGEYDVIFSTSPERIVAGKETVLKYLIKKSGETVGDLEPYLAAPMHLAIIKADLQNFIHAHGELPGGQGHEHPMGHIHGMSKEKFGPDIEAVVVFPVKGVYQIFSQIKHQGKVVLISFMAEVY